MADAGGEPDHLAGERATTHFDVDAMKIAWAGSRHAVEVADRMARLVASDPVFRKDTRMMLSRKELFKDTLKKAAHAWKRIIELRLTEEEANLLRLYIDQPGYVDLHWGLETTATFDPSTDEFVMHSPTLTSSKWWPGGLGKASTHAVVYARLITEGKDYGIHGFKVQLRSLDDHSPLPGVTLGDIGGKFGSGAYNSMDNGVLRFDHVRIPRDQMLMRLSRVTREGKYVHSDVPKQLLYGTMVYVRQTIVADASKALSRAVCMAVINYKTQQSRLFLLLASAYAYRFVGQWLKWLYTDVTQKLEAKDYSTLPDQAHACTAGLKSVTTSATAIRIIN
ncbi:peroxisomal acyl-coenzyme A oxidase 1-like [Hordeum vulgare]|nr:peroxisomal acyl-coenzyme A oxidase 1-like [Hordeum vulgare]